MAIEEQLEILQQGVDVWNIWRIQQPKTFIDLSGANLSRTDLRDANLRGVYLYEADLSGANLSGVHLINANLSAANLINANLSATNLFRANLFRANFGGAKLIAANLRGTNLIDANLSKAQLNDANLNEANLSGANFIAAKLFRTNFTGANLTGADLSGATTGITIFGNLDLRTVKGLENMKHEGPSIIGTDTLERSEGDIPETFLRGAGLSDTFITYARSLVQSPIYYYTCFISYSNKDELFAKRLHNDLQQEGVRCWFAPEDMDVGDKIKHRIDESIRLYDKLLLILSEHSITNSWVAYEVERALNKEPQGVPNVLYPVRVDQAILTCTTDWARDIKETRHIGDFEHWTDPEKYQANFQRLLRALRGKQEQGKS
jgi:uncharacterized protein YjbI with pentapeptide repeats